MKVALINPSTSFENRSALDVEGAWPPLGLLYIASILKENGVSVSVFDNGPFYYSPQKIFEWVKKEDPDVVGFHTLSMSSLTANETSKLIKKEMPNLKIIYGGYHATTRWQFYWLGVDGVYSGHGMDTCKA